MSQNQVQPDRGSKGAMTKSSSKMNEKYSDVRESNCIQTRQDFLNQHKHTFIETVDTLNFPLPGTYALYTSDGGGYVTGNNEYGDLAKANFFTNNVSLTLTGVIFDFAIAKGGNPAIEIVVWDNSGTNNSPGIVKATTSIDLNTIKNDVVNEQMTFISFDPPVILTTSFYTGLILPTATGDTVAIWSNTDGDTDPGIAWEKWESGNWYPISSNQTWSRDIAMAVFPVVKFSLSADFTSDITNVPVGQSVHFHDTSVGSPTSWEWTFEGGNPGTSAEQNPIVTYNEAGTYDVTLTIGNDTSTNTKSVADYIIVGGPSIEIDTLNYPLAGEYAVYITNGNGYVSGNNEFGDRAKANYFQSNQDLFVTGVLVEFAYATGGNPNIEIGLWNNAGTNGSPGAKIGSQTVSLNTIKTNINNQQLTYIPFNPPINVASSFYSGFMLPTVTGDTLVVWSNTDGNTNPGIAWEQWNDSQWHSFAQPDNWDLNVALAIFPIVQNTLGIKDYKMDNAINVFPNPSQGIYYVASELFNNEPGKLSIYKLDGTLIQTVVQRNGEILSIDLTNEPPGIYFVKLEIRSGIFVEKIVRQ